MDLKRTGVVSNCWRVQLEAGEAIEKLIGQTLETGFRYIELRQGCLGDCEDDADNPIPERLDRLTSSFPEATFNLAMQLPVLTRPGEVSAGQRSLAVEAAQATRGSNRGGHLRLVDLESPAIDHADFDTTRDVVVELAASLPDGVVSIENSIQPWAVFRSTFERLRESVPDLRLCYDPCNLWMPGDGDQAGSITDSIPIEWYSMVHFKQRRGNDVLTTLTDGDVDLSAQARLLTEAGYHGPLLLETTATEDVFESFRISLENLEALMAAGG